MQQTKPPCGGRRRPEAATKAAFAPAKPPREAHPARRREMSRKLLVGALFALMLSLTTLVVGSRSASAGVVENGRVEPWTQVIDNPCVDGYSPMTLTGWYHGLSYTTPEGTLMMRFTAHYKGTDADGTEWVSNTRRVMLHSDWPNGLFPFDDVVTYNLVSKGSGENSRIELTIENNSTFPVPYIVTYTCQG